MLLSNRVLGLQRTTIARRRRANALMVLRCARDTKASMTAIKASDVDRFIARPDPAQPIVLVYGPDAGLVRERVDALVRASVDDPNDPFAFVRIEGEELSANPARLVEEANTIPLFGGRRAVLLRGQPALQRSAGLGDTDRSALARLPPDHRGGRIAQNLAAAHDVREGKNGGRIALLSRRRQGAFQPDRRGNAQRQTDIGARCPRRADVITR